MSEDRTDDLTGDTLVLCQPPSMMGVPNVSPFCCKTETWLRLSGLPYVVEPVSNPRRGPKGKVPFVRLDGQKIGDSDFIIDRLCERHPGLPERLKRAEPQHHALQRMLEEHLYWVIVYGRWVDDGFELVRMAFFGGLPPVVRHLVPLLARSVVRRQLKAQGMGRHTADEVYARGTRDLEAVVALLPETGFLAGDEPGRIDASAYGVLTNVVDIDLPMRFREIGRRYPAIAAYTARMRERAFPEFARARG